MFIVLAEALSHLYIADGYCGSSANFQVKTYYAVPVVAHMCMLPRGVICWLP